MKKTLKKTLSIILAILMIVTTMPFAFAATTDGGTFGVDNALTWKLENSVLTISGNGAMAENYNEIDIPWKDYKNSIWHVVIEEGVTNVANSAFQDCSKLKTAVIPDSVTYVYDNSFRNCPSLERVVIGTGVIFFGYCAFWDTGCVVHYKGTEEMWAAAEDEYNAKPRYAHFLEYDDYFDEYYCNICSESFNTPLYDEEDLPVEEPEDNTQYFSLGFYEDYVVRDGEKEEINYYSDFYYGRNEEPLNLFDNNSETKLCMINGGNAYNFFDNIDSYVIVAKTTDGSPVSIGSYQLVTANDSPERDPDSWKLYGSTAGEDWVLIDEIEDANLPEERHEKVIFELEEPTDEYTFFMFDFTATNNDGDCNIFQLADINFIAFEHEHTGGELTCLGYKCEICELWYGEGNGIHTDGNHDCEGIHCAVCGTVYGEPKHKESEQTCKGYYCEDCGTWYGEADSNAHGWFYGTCRYCYEFFPNADECNHLNDSGGQCKICGRDCIHDVVNDGICQYCSKEIAVIDGVTYEVDGDITNTGIHIGAFAAFDNCYKAGDGYMLIKGEGNNDTVMTLYNATIDVRGTGHNDAIIIDGEDIEIRFIGENNIFADEEAYATPIGNSRHSQAFIGADDAVLNLYGNVTVSYINIESGTVNVYGADADGIESVYVERNLVVSEGAVLNIISGDNGMGFNCGIIVQKGIVAEGEFNAIALTGSETDNETIYNLTAIGNAVLGADTYNPYHGMEIPEDFNFEINFIVPEGTSVTVPEGITLNLDSMTNVDIDGKLIVYGTLICTHTDEDNDYLCDIGCGTEFADIDGVKYEVIGDVTYTGVEFSGSESMDSGCYKAGDGYVIIGEDKSELTLYNATVDLRGTDAKHALYHGTYSTAVKIFFKGINNIYPNEGGKSLVSEYVGYGNESFNFIGDDGAILNLYGDTEYTNFNFVSGEVNIYGNGATGVVSIFNNKDVTIGENATVNLVSAAGIGGFLGDVIVSENNMLTVDGVFNGVTFEMGAIVDNTMTVTYTVYGNAVAGQDYINLITESGIAVELIIPEGTSFTIPEGYAINLDTFDNVVIDGELIVDGTLICTHTGGEATCNEKAVCDICKNTYGKTLAHTDEDGDYICDNGCGYEYEKPAEPTPEAPEDTESEVCEDCGKVHDGFFAQLICFFTKIINFIKNLFA